MAKIPNKYKEGVYRVTFFDPYGTKIEEVPAEPNNFQGGVETGWALLRKSDDYGSFVVQRVLYNSKDHEFDAARYT